MRGGVVYKHLVATVPTFRDEWRIELQRQGRSLRWLALATESKPSTVYAYSMGKRRPPDGWLERVAEALGMEEAA